VLRFTLIGRSEPIWNRDVTGRHALLNLACVFAAQGVPVFGEMTGFIPAEGPCGARKDFPRLPPAISIWSSPREADAVRQRRTNTGALWRHAWLAHHFRGFKDLCLAFGAPGRSGS